MDGVSYDGTRTDIGLCLIGCGKRIRSQKLRRLPAAISAAIPRRERTCESRVGPVLTGFGLT